MDDGCSRLLRLALVGEFSHGTRDPDGTVDVRADGRGVGELLANRPADARSGWSAVLLVFALVFLVFGWSVSRAEIRSLAERRVTDELLMSRQFGIEAVQQWLDEMSSDARFWAGDPAVVDATEALLASGDDPLAATAQRSLRELQRRFLDLNQLLGYFVIAPDGTSLASSRDANVGTQNLVAARFPALFDSMLDGRTVVTPPQLTDVPLPASGGLDPDATTMFAGAPIVDEDGAVIAVFTLRIDPDAALRALLSAGALESDARIGLFDATGAALTTSGGVQVGDSYVTTDGASLIDPVRAAVAGGDGVDLIAFEGTDGRDAVGAWAWMDEVGVGVVSELSFERAFRSAAFASQILAWFAAVVAVMLVAVWMLPLVMSRRRTRERRWWDDELERASRQLDESEARYRALVEPLPDLVLRVDHELRVLDVNPAALTTLGASRDELVGRHLDDMRLELHPATRLRDSVQETLQTGRRSSVHRLFRRDPVSPGRWYDARITVREAVDGGERWAYLVISDVTESVENEHRLETLALTDGLTGIANRAAAHDRLSHALTRLDRIDGGGGIGVIVVDLDHFKVLNDLHGHQVGDLALVAVARCLDEMSREQDTVGRLGGDEFVIVAEEVLDEDAAVALADRIVTSLSHLAIAVDGRHIAIGASVGVAFTDARISSEELLTRADRALYRAKRLGRGRVLRYDARETAGPFPSASMLRRDLDAALDCGEFEVFYQPIMHETHGRVAVEALLRWRHPEHGLLLPDVFLPNLLETGAIVRVGRWVARTVLEQAAIWARVPDAGPAVHLNISPSELTALDLVVGLEAAFAATRCPRDRIAIEVTEEALAGTMVSHSSLAELSRLGIDVFLDDFGTGVSSLRHLRFDGLRGIKLDKSFVASLGTDDRVNQAITSATISMARDLGLEVIAEGVETDQQLDWLSTRGCSITQGFLHGRAVPASEVDRSPVTT